MQNVEKIMELEHAFALKDMRAIHLINKEDAEENVNPTMIAQIN
jgi:hypothetical protein